MKKTNPIQHLKQEGDPKRSVDQGASRQLPLDHCQAPVSAEHARPFDILDPCDDGRSG